MVLQRLGFVDLGLVSFLLCWSMPLHAQQSENIDSSVQAKFSKPSFKKSTKISTATATIKDITKDILNGPMGLLVTGISQADIAFIHASGQTSAGESFVNVLVPAAGLRGGKSTQYRHAGKPPSGITLSALRRRFVHESA